MTATLASVQVGLGALALGLLLLQTPATLILLSRLFKGPGRRAPLTPQQSVPETLGCVSAIVPTLNEVERIDPCLAGLTRQSYEVREILVVDSRSTDGTPERVKAIQQRDRRFHLLEDDPLPPGWVGRPWALHWGFLASSDKSEWVLGIDADTQPQPGLVAALLAAANSGGYDLISLSPQFVLEYPGEWWLQPALLVTLLYRFDPAGADGAIAERVMANGQCFFCRRQVLEHLGGYTSAASSFCDDVTLARNIARAGYKVGFLDGAQVLKVRMYEGAAQTWQEWGRSLDLKDASTPSQVASDLWLLLCTQGLPLPVLLLLLVAWNAGAGSPALLGAMALNGFLGAMRFGLLFAIRGSYARSNSLASLLFWLSPTADFVAVVRIFLSALKRPKSWRGRTY